MEKPRTVKLREKELTDGRLSLYLDFYPPIYIPETGKETRITESLNFIKAELLKCWNFA